MTLRFTTSGLSAALVLAAISANATEFGQSHADLGYIDTLAGLPLAPGIYLRDDINIQTSGQFTNGEGKQVSLNLGQNGTFGTKFRNTIEADVISAAYVPDYKIPYINATVGAAMYEPIANSRAGLSTIAGVPEASANEKGGFGDITVVPLFPLRPLAVRVHSADRPVFQERSDRQQYRPELLELPAGAGIHLPEQDGSGVQPEHERVDQHAKPGDTLQIG
jgi:hypothetical protein